MENRFNNRDFEQFVKDNADQYRMYPSDHVWKGIHNTLHTRRRWYGIGLGFLILTAGVVTWVMMASTGRNNNAPAPVAGLQPAKTITAPPKPKDLVTVTPEQENSFITPVDNTQKKLFRESPDLTIPETITAPAVPTAAETGETTVVTKPETSLPAEPVIKAPLQPVTSVVAKSVVPAAETRAQVPVHQFSFIAAPNPVVQEAVPVKETYTPVSLKETNPLTIESVVNSYTHIRKKKKVSFQVYLTPTISYRKLKENKIFTNSARNSISSGITSSSYNYIDINNLVTHKPDIGVQLGFSAGYPLTRDLTLIGGLQFNVSKYDIKAYTHPGEIATIALQNTAGGTNTVSTVTNYRNTGGYKANWLHNLYFSASAPVGLELNLARNRRSYFGVSATAQPTYVIGNRAYLISTDYKNYAEVPSLTRKWNINAGFEAFAGNSTGKFRWRIGPQVRYQAKSSFENKYPVQEHLFDFGLKLGIMLKN